MSLGEVGSLPTRTRKESHLRPQGGGPAPGRVWQSLLPQRQTDPSVLETNVSWRVQLGCHPRDRAACAFLGTWRLSPHHIAFQRKAPATCRRIAGRETRSLGRRRAQPVRSRQERAALQKQGERAVPTPCTRQGTSPAHQCVGSLGTRTGERNMEGHACPSPCTSGLGGCDETQSQTFPEISCDVPASPGAPLTRPRRSACGRSTGRDARRAHPVPRRPGRGARTAPAGLLPRPHLCPHTCARSAGT